jgi:hypothetical protein
MPRSQQSSRTSKPSALIAKPHAPVVVHQPTVEKPGFGQLIKEGIGFGAGQAIAHRAVNAILGPSVAQVAESKPSETITKCIPEKKAFEMCLKTKTQESQCDNEFIAFTQCIQFS